MGQPRGLGFREQTGSAKKGHFMHLCRLGAVASLKICRLSWIVRLRQREEACSASFNGARLGFLVRVEGFAFRDRTGGFEYVPLIGEANTGNTSVLATPNPEPLTVWQALSCKSQGPHLNLKPSELENRSKPRIHYH